MGAPIGHFDRAVIRLEPWAEDDLPLLERLTGDPAMTENLGGPESREKIVERQKLYERLPSTGKGQMFKIVETDTGERVGWVGYWERESSEATYTRPAGWCCLHSRGAASRRARLHR
jgi:hypothetical protein